MTAGCDRRTHYDWLHTDSAYAAAFEQAKAMACDRIEQEIHRRGVEGWDEPVYHGGQQVGVVRRYSDTLLIFLAKGMMPAKYRDRHEVTHDLSPAMQALYAEWEQLRAHPELAEDAHALPAGPITNARWTPAYMPGLDDDAPQEYVIDPDDPTIPMEDAEG